MALGKKPAKMDSQTSNSATENSNQVSKFQNKLGAHMGESSVDEPLIKDSFNTDYETQLITEQPKGNKNCFQKMSHSLREGSSYGAVVTLVMTAAVGPGVLSLAYAVAASGWVLSLILMLFSAIICNFTLKLMAKVAKITGKFSYSGIAEHLFPKSKKVAMLVRVSLFFNNFGEATANLILINDLITRCLRNLNISSLPELITDPSINFWPVFLGVFISFPLCLKQSFKELRVILFSGFILIIYVIIVIFKDAVMDDFVEDFLAAKRFDPMGIFTTLPITFFSFACHPVVLDGYRELEVPNERKFRKVLKKTVTMLLWSYAMIGIFGYIHFARNEHELAEGNLLLAYSPDDILVDLAILFFALTISVALPLGIKPVKNVLSEILKKEGEEESPKKHVILTAIIVGGVIVCSATVSNMTLVVNFLGASFNAMIVFIFPCIFYMTLVKRKNRPKTPIYWIALVVAIFISIFSIFSVSYLIYCKATGKPIVGLGLGNVLGQ